jgi:hypothetical protein
MRRVSTSFSAVCIVMFLCSPSLVVAQTTQHSTTAGDDISIREVARKYLGCLYSGDSHVRELVVTSSEPSKTLFDALVESWQADEELRVAVMNRADARAQSEVRHAKDLENLLKMMQESPLHVEGSAATLSKFNFAFTRTADGWKLDVARTYARDLAPGSIKLGELRRDIDASKKVAA